MMVGHTEDLLPCSGQLDVFPSCLTPDGNSAPCSYSLILAWWDGEEIDRVKMRKLMS